MDSCEKKVVTKKGALEEGRARTESSGGAGKKDFFERREKGVDLTRTEKKEGMKGELMFWLGEKGGLKDRDSEGAVLN